jgi:hypothetical protein
MAAVGRYPSASLVEVSDFTTVVRIYFYDKKDATNVFKMHSPGRGQDEPTNIQQEGEKVAFWINYRVNKEQNAGKTINHLTVLAKGILGEEQYQRILRNI